jgi:hypothetical protein
MTDLSKRRRRRRVEQKKRELVERFARWLSTAYPDTLPLPGYYFPTEDGFGYSTEQEQDEKAERMDPTTTRFVMGLFAEGAGSGDVRALPTMVIVSP